MSKQSCCPKCGAKIYEIYQEDREIKRFALIKEKYSRELIPQENNTFSEVKFLCPRCNAEIAENIKEAKKIMGIKVSELSINLKHQTAKQLKQIMAKFRNNKRSNLFNRVTKIKKQIQKTTNMPRWLTHESDEELTQIILKSIMKVMIMP